jgi:hypothetical protein
MTFRLGTRDGEVAPILLQLVVRTGKDRARAVSQFCDADIVG